MNKIMERRECSDKGEDEKIDFGDRRPEAAEDTAEYKNRNATVTDQNKDGYLSESLDAYAGESTDEPVGNQTENTLKHNIDKKAEEYGMEAVLCQVRQILLKKPVDQWKTRSQTQKEAQEALIFLRDKIEEIDQFLRYLSVGDLNHRPPGRDNLLAGGLKELHSGLLHLTWQANQVAKGDYHQRVNFLGQFSEAFNSMVRELEERENKLTDKAEALRQSTELLEAVVDGMEEWLVVVERKSSKVIYSNRSARRDLFLQDDGSPGSIRDQRIREWLLCYDGRKDASHYEFYCGSRKKMLAVDSFYIVWRDEGAYAHLFSDITRIEQLKLQAYRDELTGLKNRRAAVRVMEELEREKTPFVLCYLDIDGLKYVNDHYGHRFGDEYIQTVASGLREAMREGESVCRIGGDEFLWICPEQTEKDVAARGAFFARNIEHMEKDYPMSVSYGCMVFPGKTGPNLESLLEEADRRMYHMKRRRKKERNPD